MLRCSAYQAPRERFPKSEADCREQESSSPETDRKCAECKFNLGDEKKCQIVEGEIANNGLSKFFSPKGDGMVPPRRFCMGFIKKTGRELDYEEGYVINKGAEGFQCKECKYYIYSEKCS